jgi:RNA polymerase sigma-70 factor (ECF subfamily)
MSAETPGLLQRLRQFGDESAWARFVDLFSAHLFLWACRAGLPGAQAADLVRDLFEEIARRLPEFHAGSPGGFRGWMRGLAHARRLEVLQKRKAPAGGAAETPQPIPPVPEGADVMWGAEYLPSLLRAAVDLLQPEFPAAEWKACWGIAVEGRPAEAVALELGIPPVAVYAAEARVLRRLRQELDGLLD